MKLLVAQYEEFLQSQCARCSQSLKDLKNRPKGKLGYSSLWYSGKQITNFKAIATVYGLSHKTLAEKLAKCFRNCFVTENFVLRQEGYENEEPDGEELEIASNKLSFCRRCYQLFEDMHRINREFRDVSHKSSLLSKSLDGQFGNIEDQKNNYEELEIKYDDYIEEDNILEDPLRIEIEGKDLDILEDPLRIKVKDLDILEDPLRIEGKDLDILEDPLRIDPSLIANENIGKKIADDNGAFKRLAANLYGTPESANLGRQIGARLQRPTSSKETESTFQNLEDRTVEECHAHAEDSDLSSSTNNKFPPAKRLKTGNSNCPLLEISDAPRVIEQSIDKVKPSNYIIVHYNSNQKPKPEFDCPEIRTVRSLSEKDTFSCGECPNEYFESFQSLSEHIRLSKHKSPKIMCAFCCKLFSDTKTLELHKTTLHQGLLKEIESRKEKVQYGYKCTFCDKVFPSHRECHLHSKAHVAEKVVYGRTQNPTTSMTSSSLSHRVNNPIKEESKKNESGITITGVYTGVGQFKKHARKPTEITSGVKPVSVYEVCDFCGKSFTTKMGLNIHRNFVHASKEPKSADTSVKPSGI